MLPLALRSSLKRRLWWLTPALHALRAGTPNPIHIWHQDPEFRELMYESEPRTLVDWAACYVLFRTARICSHIPGEFAELGVYRGGTARILAAACAPKKLHLFDTFRGMPDTDRNRDKHRAKDFNDTSLPSVQAFLATCRNVEFHPGLFPATVTGLDDARFAFVHVDADIYQSVASACAFFYPRLEPGGAIVFDDYGFVSTPGARTAVDEYFIANGAGALPIYLPTGQALIHKSPRG